MPRNKDYKVGYGRTPEASRYKKGQSGNPQGKVKGSKSLAEMILAAVRESVVITENGKRKTITKFEAALKQMSNRAAGGDFRATGLLLSVTPSAEAKVQNQKSGHPASESDREILREFIVRFKDFTDGGSDE